MAYRIILDTDIGTDVDDLLALSVILSSPELELAGITCVYGDTHLRAQICHKVLRLTRRDVPVLQGARESLLSRRPVYWAGHEGVGVVTPDDPPAAASTEDATKFLIQSVLASPGSIHLVAIAPLTNLALAFLREPTLASRLAGITLMGSVARSISRLDLPVTEHNILCDPDAAQIVFQTCTAANTPVTIVPLDLTTLVRIYPQDVARIRERGTQLHALIASQVETYPWFQKSGSTALHDPLAVASLIDPTLITTIPVTVNVELTGSHTLGMTVFQPAEASSIRLAVDVDKERAAAFIVDRITQLETD